MKTEEVSRMFMPRKSLQRSNSSSSLGSNSSTSTVSISSQSTNAGQNANSELGAWSSSKKKPSRSIWPSAKSEPVSGVTNARSQASPVLSTGPTASSTMSAIHQPSHVLPSQHILQASPQNGARQVNGSSGDPPAILTLIPLNGTFEKKHITVPYYPEVLRIGRQTNAKTVPTPVNGYFDSKVLSRQHAEVWADRNGKVWIRDVKSSNGTFVNAIRLSPDSRESDPHELHENDILELGIDIVSEDQKTIVHQKVSAKVEHAGIYGAGLNILDLNFGDLDPASGNGLLSSPLNQPVSHFRGRSGSTASNRSNQSVASSQMSALQQQRQANYWNSPITIEHVVKRLTNEMKQARQQAHDLRQTDDFLKAASKPGGVEKERSKHSPLDGNSLHRQLNGRPKLPRVDSLSRFSDPPAPPPQQPLPEKPGAPPRNGGDAFSALKRSDTEKPKSPGPNSPASRESSQILSLIEALSSAKREIDSQGARVKELEGLLRQERTAREWAEERVRKLERLSGDGKKQIEAGSRLEPSIEKEQGSAPEISARESTLQSNGDITSDAAPTVDKSAGDAAADLKTKQLEQRLQGLMQEMEEMKKQVAAFKQRAQKEEAEKLEARKSLAEMIDMLRRERSQDRQVPQAGTTTDAQSLVTMSDVSSAGEEVEFPRSGAQDLTGESPESDVLLHTKEIEHGATALRSPCEGRYNLLEQSSPYASMLGVVLLGVGLMAYLNGWQKLDK